MTHIKGGEIIRFAAELAGGKWLHCFKPENGFEHNSRENCVIQNRGQAQKGGSSLLSSEGGS